MFIKVKAERQLESGQWGCLCDVWIHVKNITSVQDVDDITLVVNDGKDRYRIQGEEKKKAIEQFEEILENKVSKI